MPDPSFNRVSLSTGVTLNVATAGDPAAAAVILLHGFPESHRTWLEIALRLLEHCDRLYIGAGDKDRRALNQAFFCGLYIDEEGVDLPQVPEEMVTALQGVEGPARLADFISGLMDVGAEEKQSLLETFDLKARLDKLLELLARRIEVLKVSREIDERTRETISDNNPHDRAPATADDKATRQATFENGNKTVKSHV